MVEDRVLDEIKTKAKNLLKHYPCRNLKLKEVSEVVSEPTIGFAIRISAEGPDWNFENISLFKKKDLKDPSLAKKCVEKLLQAIPSKFATANVTNVNESAKDIMHNFSGRDIPNTFIIEKLPYRQLQIKFADYRIFLKLNIKSYQRVLALFDQQKSWPAELQFDALASCLKRKEIVTLLLYLSSAN